VSVDVHIHRPYRTSAVCVRGRIEDLLERGYQRGQVLCHDLPDDVFIHAKVVVHDLVAHPDDVLPRDLWVFVTALPRHAPCSFTDHLNKM